MSSLFIYWKLPAAQAEAGLAAARQWQAGLRARHPGLQAALYLRRGDGGDSAQAVQTVQTAAMATVMETYALAGGIGDALAAEIELTASSGLQGLGAPLRHVEVFDAVNA